MKLSGIEPLYNLNSPILITGHTGFKGAWLTLLLDQLGIEWSGLSLPPLENSLYSKTRPEASTEEYCDIRDFRKVERMIRRLSPSFIIHLAAEAQVLSAASDPIHSFETNVMGTANILEVARYLPSLKGIVVSTTDKVYLNDNQDHLFNEADSLGGSEPYSGSKVGQEAAIDSWLGLPRNGNYPITSVRAGNVIGGGDISSNRLLPDLIRALETGENLKVRNLNHTRPWQHALDPLFGYLQVCAHQLGPKVERAFNFGPSGPSMSVEAVLSHSRKILGPRFPGIDKADMPLRVESEKLSLSSEKAIALLQWNPVWDQLSAIESTVNWWVNIEKMKTPTQACILDIEKLLSCHSAAKV